MTITSQARMGKHLQKLSITAQRKYKGTATRMHWGKTQKETQHQHANTEDFSQNCIMGNNTIHRHKGQVSHHGRSSPNKSISVNFRCPLQICAVEPLFFSLFPESDSFFFSFEATNNQKFRAIWELDKWKCRNSIKLFASRSIRR